jgi:hypothetical protein
MVIFQFYFIFIYPSSVNRALEKAFPSVGLFGGVSPDFDPILNLLCVVGPLGLLNSLLLIILLLYSGYKWLTERDLLAALRVTPNEFNEDDLMAVSKAVEQTVHICMDEIGLNPDDLKYTKSIDNRRII